MYRAVAAALSLTLLPLGPGWTQTAGPGAARTGKAADPFIGTWKMNPAKSELDPNHRAAEARMYWEAEGGGYRMSAAGVNARGQVVKETPQRFVPDGKAYPVPGAPGVTATVSRPDSHTIVVESRKNGNAAGRATYAVSPDGKSLTATVSGVDGKQRAFRTRMIFDRE